MYLCVRLVQGMMSDVPVCTDGTMMSDVPVCTAGTMMSDVPVCGCVQTTTAYRGTR